ncbi:MAG: VanZ family protein [Chloroflexi bacterium]|nr:VanZ family protein [Chloroflexota bacterium]
MQARRGWLSPRWAAAFVAYLLVLAAIVWLAYLRLIPTELGYIPFYDTIGHFGLLGSAAYLSHRALNRRAVRVWRWRLPVGPMLVAALAFGEECSQMFSPYRTFSLSDMLADLGGILFFLWLDGVLRKAHAHDASA